MATIMNKTNSISYELKQSKFVFTTHIVKIKEQYYHRTYIIYLSDRKAKVEVSVIEKKN